MEEESCNDSTREESCNDSTREESYNDSTREESCNDSTRALNCCPFCSKAFGRMGPLQAHINLHHSQEDSDPHVAFTKKSGRGRQSGRGRPSGRGRGRPRGSGRKARSPPRKKVRFDLPAPQFSCPCGENLPDEESRLEHFHRAHPCALDLEPLENTISRLQEVMPNLRYEGLWDAEEFRQLLMDGGLGTDESPEPSIPCTSNQEMNEEEDSPLPPQLIPATSSEDMDEEEAFEFELPMEEADSPAAGLKMEAQVGSDSTWDLVRNNHGSPPQLTQENGHSTNESDAFPASASGSQAAPGSSSGIRVSKVELVGEEEETSQKRKNEANPLEEENQREAPEPKKKKKKYVIPLFDLNNPVHMQIMKDWGWHGYVPLDPDCISEDKVMLSIDDGEGNLQPVSFPIEWEGIDATSLVYGGQRPAHLERLIKERDAQAESNQNGLEEDEG